MAVAVTPSALPAPKKGTNYLVFLTATSGTAPFTWSVSAGALPAFLTLQKFDESGASPNIVSRAIVSGKVPSTLDATTFTATIQATDGATSATCVSTGVAKGVDGPDPQGFHGATEAARTSVTTIDQIEHGTGLPVADMLARMWPNNPPSQNS